MPRTNDSRNDSDLRMQTPGHKPDAQSAPVYRQQHGVPYALWLKRMGMV